MRRRGFIEDGIGDAARAALTEGSDSVLLIETDQFCPYPLPPFLLCAGKEARNKIAKDSGRILPGAFKPGFPHQNGFLVLWTVSVGLWTRGQHLQGC
jgi:hypothetical protein